MSSKINTRILGADSLKIAAALLQKGELVAFPTETVYGLGARMDDEKAIDAVFIAKGRPANNPLIVHFSDLSQLAGVVESFPDSFYLLFKAFSPGPLTFVLKKHPSVSNKITAGLDKVAVRMPAHPFARELINLTGVPLVAPSANLSGKPSPTKAYHVLEDLDGVIAAVVDGGPCSVGIESTVIDLTGNTPCILRPGTISKATIEELLNYPIDELSQLHKEKSVASPGLLHRHYAPKGEVYLFNEIGSLHAHLKNSHQKTVVFSNEKIENLEGIIPLSEATYYAGLRFADQMNAAEIIVFCDPITRQSAGLMNRILRSAEKDKK